MVDGSRASLFRVMKRIRSRRVFRTLGGISQERVPRGRDRWSGFGVRRIDGVIIRGSNLRSWEFVFVCNLDCLAMILG
jgi:hypothetical protein